MIGSRILHYEIRAVLGRGGMGEVYLARDTRLDREVALKFLPESLRQDPHARERLIREARAASRLTHTHIVAIHAIEEVDGQDFIVMEYVDGRSLAEVIREGGLSLEKALEFGRQICEALEAAHEMGIVHRDIKAENVLVAGRDQVKVLDFGLAKVGGATRLTEAGSTLGTMAYMSPEQVQGQEADPRSDLFSFGVLLYEMITGRLPFEGAERGTLASAILHLTPEPLARYKSNVPEDVERLVEKLLRKDPKTRYQGAADVLADLTAHQTQTHSLVRPTTAARPRRRGLLVAGLALVALAVGVLWIGRTGRGPVPGAGGDGRIMLAVLPFENLSGGEDEYFADGITEEITARLASLKGLGVIARTSVLPFKGTGKSIREIGDELGVDYVLEGTVRWQKSPSGGSSKVRVTPQLIRVSDGTHLWANVYDQALTEVFAMQSDIALQVAGELDVALLEPERESIERKPTEDLQAYDFYLRGLDYYRNWLDPKHRDLSIQMFERAVEIDPAFSLAQAWLARIYANDFFNHLHPDQPRLEQAKHAAEAALRSAPGRPEGHWAMGYYHYYAGRDYDAALEEFARAAEGWPNDSDLLVAIGYVQRRQGRWAESVANQKRAVALDPRGTSKSFELVNTLVLMRRFAEAETYLDRIEALAPDQWPTTLIRGWIRVVRDGDIEGAGGIIDPVIPQVLASFAAESVEGLDFLARDYEACLERRRAPRAGIQGDSARFYLNRAIAYRMLERLAPSAAYVDSARSVLERRVEAAPADAAAHGDLGVVYALLGRQEEALHQGQRALEIMPISKDAMAGVDHVDRMLTIRILLGRYEEAIDDLEYLTTLPSYFTPAYLELDPRFDPLRDHSRFQRLLRSLPVAF